MEYKYCGPFNPFSPKRNSFHLGISNSFPNSELDNSFLLYYDNNHTIYINV